MFNSFEPIIKFESSLFDKDQVGAPPAVNETTQEEINHVENVVDAGNLGVEIREEIGP